MQRSVQKINLISTVLLLACAPAAHAVFYHAELLQHPITQKTVILCAESHTDIKGLAVTRTQRQAVLQGAQRLENNGISVCLIPEDMAPETTELYYFTQQKDRTYDEHIGHIKLVTTTSQRGAWQPRYDCGPTQGITGLAHTRGITVYNPEFRGNRASAKNYIYPHNIVNEIQRYNDGPLAQRIYATILRNYHAFLAANRRKSKPGNLDSFLLDARIIHTLLHCPEQVAWVGVGGWHTHNLRPWLVQLGYQSIQQFGGQLRTEAIDANRYGHVVPVVNIQTVFDYAINQMDHGDNEYPVAEQTVVMPRIVAAHHQAIDMQKIQALIKQATIKKYVVPTPQPTRKPTRTSTKTIAPVQRRPVKQVAPRRATPQRRVIIKPTQRPVISTSQINRYLVAHNKKAAITVPQPQGFIAKMAQVVATAKRAISNFIRYLK